MSPNEIWTAMAVVYHRVLAPLAGAAIVFFAAGMAGAPAAPRDHAYTVVPETIAGSSRNGLGSWRVEYQRLRGGNLGVADDVNTIVDARVQALIAAAECGATDTKPWTLLATGTLFFGPTTVSELFVGEYHTDEPGTPVRIVATAVVDRRSGTQITWNNLFTDKHKGLIRLSEQTRVIVPAVYPPPSPGRWNPESFAAREVNFPAWIPTAAGIQIHFADGQFGRSRSHITVPWGHVADLVAPRFLAIVG